MTTTNFALSRLARDGVCVALALLVAGGSLQSLRAARRVAWSGRLLLATGLLLLTGAAAPPPPRPAFYVQVTGQGRPMILIPGLSSSGPGTWDATVAQFKNQYRCYVLTLAGFAGEPPITAPLLSTVRDQLAAYIAAHHLARPVIVGHSLGGLIALDLAARYPDRVGAVVIVDSLPFFAGAWFQAPNVAAAQPMIARIRQGMESMPPAQWKAYAESGAATNSLVTSPANQKKLIAWATASDQGTVTRALLALMSTDLRPELPRITAPVLVIGTWIGLQETYHVSREQAMRIFHEQYAGVRQLQFVMCDNARHFVMLDQPAWFYRELRSSLTAHAR